MHCPCTLTRVQSYCNSLELQSKPDVSWCPFFEGSQAAILVAVTVRNTFSRPSTSKSFKAHWTDLGSSLPMSRPQRHAKSQQRSGQWPAVYLVAMLCPCLWDFVPLCWTRWCLHQIVKTEFGNPGLPSARKRPPWWISREAENSRWIVWLKRWMANDYLWYWRRRSLGSRITQKHMLYQLSVAGKGKTRKQLQHVVSRIKLI